MPQTDNPHVSMDDESEAKRLEELHGVGIETLTPQEVQNYSLNDYHMTSDLL